MQVPDIDRRRQWLAVLAKAQAEEIAAAWRDLGLLPAVQRLRGPETGLVMLQGRVGGEGPPFNLGEMTVTRCTVRLEDGRIGHATVAGRDGEQAERIAVLDALLQDPARHDAIHAAVLAPLAAAQSARRDAAARKAGATKVEFFTLVRGED